MQGIGNNGIILACNNRSTNCADNDYYATDPIAVEKLLKKFAFHKEIWEPACGEGHISKVLEAHGYDVISTDLIYRGYGEKEPYDFLTSDECDLREDIITNPPYKRTIEFLEKALSMIVDKQYVALLLKITFLSGKTRHEFYKKNPPKQIYVFSDRIECAKNGIFEGKKAVDYIWAIWEKGYEGPTYLDWI